MKPVLKLEMSRGRVLGAVGNDEASSAQSKHRDAGVKWGGTAFGYGETGSIGGKMGAAGSRQGLGNGQGVSMVVNDVDGAMVGV
jgi:hypothetical protein